MTEITDKEKWMNLAQELELENMELKDKLKIAQDAIEWEERRCGSLTGPLDKALRRIKWIGPKNGD